MGAFILAWVVGESIVVYRSIKYDKAPPQPRALFFSSAVFALLALVAQSERARPVATLTAWGFDIAAFMNLFDPASPLRKLSEGSDKRPAGGIMKGSPPPAYSVPASPGKLPKAHS